MIQLTAVAQRVLIVGEEVQTVEPLVSPLRHRGCWVETANHADEAVQLAATLNPTLVLIGDALSDTNSVELSMRIRSAVSPDVAPLFIMAPSCDSVCAGSELADFERGMGGLVHQLSDLFASLGDDGDTVDVDRPSETSRLQCNGVCLDRVRHRVWVDDDELHLTPTEFKLLWQLAVQPGFVRSREELTLACKGTTRAVQTRTVDAHIKAIRRKLKDRGVLIETVHGVGYRFRDSEW